METGKEINHLKKSYFDTRMIKELALWANRKSYSRRNRMSVLDAEYSTKFDDLRKNRVEVSYYKYGPIKENYGKGYINALESHDRAIKKYIETGNT